MPQDNPELVAKVRECRIASLGCELTLKNHEILPEVFGSVSFRDGEILSVELLDGTLFKRGAAIRVNSKYTGRTDAVITGFRFGSSSLPVVISSGGAVGELAACVHFREITLFPKQTGKADVVRLRAEHVNAA